MQTRVSTKGQVVLPGPIRRKLGLRAGDKLDASVEGGRIVLTPSEKARFEPKIVKDPVTGRVALGKLNLEGDGQADLSVHGGPDKAVYCYPLIHYDYWKGELPGRELPWLCSMPGAPTW